MTDVDKASAPDSAPDPLDTGLTGFEAKPPSTARRIGRTLTVASAASIGIFSLATVGFVTAPAMFGKTKRGEIRVGQIDLPDIKDGVPPLTSAGTPVRLIAPASVTPAPSPVAAAIPPKPALSPLSAALSASAGSGASLLAPPTVAPAPLAPRSGGLPVVAAKPNPEVKPIAVAAPPHSPAPVPPVRAVSLVRTAPEPAATASLQVTAPPAPALATPRPPTPPSRAAVQLGATRLASVQPTPVAGNAVAPASATSQAGVVPQAVAAPRPPRVTSAKPKSTPRTDLAEPTTTAALEPRKVAEEEEHFDVLGLKVPTIGTTANRIKNGVDAFGDAVASLPGRF